MNGNKRINNLKKLVVIISIAILVVSVILIMSIYNNKFGKVGGSSEGGRSTVSTTTTDIIINPDNGEEITNAVTEPTTEETTTTEARTTAPTTKSTKSTYKTQKPTNSPTVATQPPVKYNIVDYGNSSGFENADSAAEWELFNEINSRRTNKLKMASELRSSSENAAKNASNSYASSIEAGFCTCANDPDCHCDPGSLNGKGGIQCAYSKKSASAAADAVIAVSGNAILDESYEYIGVGVVKKHAYSTVHHIDQTVYAYVVIVY